MGSPLNEPRRSNERVRGIARGPSMTEFFQEKPTGRPGHFLEELRTTFAGEANRTAIRYQGESLTYGDLDTRARRCAGLLRELGVEPGDRVAIATAEKLPFL